MPGGGRKQILGADQPLHRGVKYCRGDSPGLESPEQLQPQQRRACSGAFRLRLGQVQRMQHALDSAAGMERVALGQQPEHLAALGTSTFRQSVQRRLEPPHSLGWGWAMRADSDSRRGDRAAPLLPPPATAPPCPHWRRRGRGPPGIGSPASPAAAALRPARPTPARTSPSLCERRTGCTRLGPGCGCGEEAAQPSRAKLRGAGRARIAECRSGGKVPRLPQLQCAAGTHGQVKAGRGGIVLAGVVPGLAACRCQPELPGKLAGRAPEPLCEEQPHRNVARCGRPA